MTKNKNQRILNNREKHQSSLIANKKVNLSVWLLAFGIAIITFIVFSPSLKCGFVWDDEIFITQNPLVVNNSIAVKKIFTSVVNENDYYPVTIISLACNYHFNKLNPTGYHLWNLLLHVLNTLFVFWFIFILTKKNLLMAAMVALFFGIHPMHVESITWLTERKDVLFMFFFLLGLITYLRFRESGKWWWYVVTTILFILSCLSKGTAVSFPAILLLIDYFMTNKLNKKMFIEKIPWFLISIGFVFITYWLHKTGSLRYDIDNRTILQKVIFASYDALWYMVKFVIPANLSPYYLAPELNDIPVLFYISPFIFLTLSVIVYIYIKKNKAIIFGLLFYLFSIALMLQFVYSGASSFIIADRYIYLPSVGLIFIVAYGVNYVFQKKNMFRYIAIGLTIIYGFILCDESYARIKVWQNNETLWTDAINKNPSACYIGYNNRGNYYMYVTKDYEKALADYNKSIEIGPHFYKSFYNRGVLYFNQNKYELAMMDFNKSLELNSNNEFAYNNRGLIYYKTGKGDLALKDYMKALEINPDYENVYYNRGLLYNYTFNQFDQALADYNKALAINPRYTEVFFYRGILLGKMGKSENAIIDFSKAIELDASIPDYWINRSFIENNIGKKQEATADAIKAQQLGMQVDAGYLKELGIK